MELILMNLPEPPTLRDRAGVRIKYSRATRLQYAREPMNTDKIVDAVLRELEDSDYPDEPDYLEEEPEEMHLGEDHSTHYSGYSDLPDSNAQPWVNQHYSRSRYSRISSPAYPDTEEMLKEALQTGDNQFSRAAASQYARQRYAERGRFGGRS